MLRVPTEFPHAGSRAFLKDSADPVTIIRRNDDGTAFIRRDPRRGEVRNRDASGNGTVPLANLFATEHEAALAGLKQPTGGRPMKGAGMPVPKRQARRKTQKRRTAPQGRPAARSDAPAGRVSEEIARADARAEHTK